MVKLWTINVILVLIAALGIWSLFISKKSRSKIPIAVSLIILPLILALINNWWSFRKDPLAQAEGVLKPKKTNVRKPPDNERGAYLYYTGLQLFEVRGENVTYQPFGPNVAFSLRRTSEGLLISMMIQSFDGKSVAEIRDNRWFNPNNRYRKNFDDSALEIIDEYLVPVLQVEYLDPYTVKIGGVFRTEKMKVSELYHEFPCAQDPCQPAAFRFPPDTALIAGETIIAEPWPFDQKETDSLIALAKHYLKPWFDYSKPGKLGIRKTVNEETTLHVNISKIEQHKYTRLSNEDLKKAVEKFVGEMREFLSQSLRTTAQQLQQEQQELTKYWQQMDLAKSEKSMKQADRFVQEYQIRFRSDAIILRNELCRRLSVGTNKRLQLSLYERPTNYFGGCMVADELEKLADSLP